MPAVSRIASAQTYPSRPVRLIVATPAGGPSDITARVMGQWLSDRFGQAFIIDNRPGAGGNIGTEAVVKAPPDGYTLLEITGSHAINATLYDKLNFNFIRDIAPVASIMRVPGVMVVNRSFPSKTVAEFIAYAKANPDKINMASAGIGSTQHVYGELFKAMARVNMLHAPYRGEATAMTDLISGQVQVMFGNMATSIEHIRAGRVRALGVTSTTRSDVLPDIPVLGDFLPGYEASGFQGIGVPRNTPAEIIEKLNREINVSLDAPDMKARLADLGGIPLRGTPSNFGKLIAEETEKWAKVIRAANIKAQ
jgi:tripartite-type tricarboxylate transporter receptor subunit TctC